MKDETYTPVPGHDRMDAIMICPKCRSPLEQIGFHGIFFDRCGGCKGIWFNSTAHKALKKIRGSESIDTGSAMEGHRMDGMAEAACPVCGKIMITMRDRYQPHIRYEACMSGDGVFFDAGEFRDFKSENLGDFFNSLAWYFREPVVRFQVTSCSGFNSGKPAIPKV
jgi:Zn-finger nucleic acid-binding protein